MMVDPDINAFADTIFSLKPGIGFEKAALEIFRYQAVHCKVYREYIHYLNIDAEKIESIFQIPFTPVYFFKTNKIFSSGKTPGHVFYSSGTTGVNTSRHFVHDLGLYEKSIVSTFQSFYGDISNYKLLALLPSYFDRQGSSLVYMVRHLINLSGHTGSGFYLNNIEELVAEIQKPVKENQRIILIGVSFALLDLAKQYKLNLKNAIVMETGGMKGRRSEITRSELHGYLCERLGVENIHSEYGMTELLSQAYSSGNGIFRSPPWMKILIRDIYDPFTYLETGKAGGINIIDLANIWSCAFIETQDIGRLHKDGSFEVEGRIDNSDIRGCNLLI